MLYNQVFIKSKEDLPKTDDLYVCLFKNGSVGKCTYKVDCSDDDKYIIDFFWLHNVESYFQQIPEQTYYKKVFLKSPADLPKEDRMYIVYTSVGFEKIFLMTKEQIGSSIVGYLEWYLQPLPESPQRSITD
jgi:hypothetical protein